MRIILSSVLILLFTSISSGQDYSWKVVFSDGNSVEPVALLTVVNDTLKMSVQGSFLRVPVEHIEQVTHNHEPPFVTAARVGSLVGSGLGYLIGYLNGPIIGPDDNATSRAQGGALSGALLGGLAGLGLAGAVNHDDVYDFSNRSRKSRSNTLYWLTHQQQ
jgi:hypothetical protein